MGGPDVIGSPRATGAAPLLFDGSQRTGALLEWLGGGSSELGAELFMSPRALARLGVHLAEALHGGPAFADGALCGLQDLLREGAMEVPDGQCGDYARHQIMPLDSGGKLATERGAGVGYDDEEVDRLRVRPPPCVEVGDCCADHDCFAGGLTEQSGQRRLARSDLPDVAGGAERDHLGL